MKTSTLFSLALVLLGYTASAQKFTLLPQVGIQNASTRINYNNLANVNPLQSQVSPLLGLRMDYKLKNGFGPYVGLTTNRQTVSYSFTNPESGFYNFIATPGSMQLQLQAGLQASTKPIYFKKAPVAKAAPLTPIAKTSYNRCGNNKFKSQQQVLNRNAPPAKTENKSWFVSIQPSIGLAFNPNTPSNVNSNYHTAGNTASYLAGNTKTALITGVAFEMGSNAQKHFTVALNYFKGLGNNAETITTDAGLKSINTNLQSAVSGWNASVGIPISFSKKAKKAAPQKVEQKNHDYKKYYHPYKSNCRKSN